MEGILIFNKHLTFFNGNCFISRLVFIYMHELIMGLSPRGDQTGAFLVIILSFKLEKN